MPRGAPHRVRDVARGGARALRHLAVVRPLVEIAWRSELTRTRGHSRLSPGGREDAQAQAATPPSRRENNPRPESHLGRKRDADQRPANG